MKGKRISDEQIVTILKEAECKTSTAQEICRKHGASAAGLSLIDGYSYERHDRARDTATSGDLRSSWLSIDGLGRLTREDVSMDGGASIEQTSQWSMDASGNRLSFYKSGESIQLISGESDDSTLTSLDGSGAVSARQQSPAGIRRTRQPGVSLRVALE